MQCTNHCSTAQYSVVGNQLHFGSESQFHACVNTNKLYTILARIVNHTESYCMYTIYIWNSLRGNFDVNVIVFVHTRN